MRNFMTKRMSARARLAAGTGSALGVALLVAACGTGSSSTGGGGQQFAGRGVERRRQRRFGFYGHHDRLIVGGHVLDH
jgi:hypothetical protein